MFDSGSFLRVCHLVREQSPIVHNITNPVAMSLSANALLAVGASPLMSSEPAEMEEIVSSASALVINVGCIEARQLNAMEIAAKTATAQGKPWVLDPAGVGLSRLRVEAVASLIGLHPSLIRGNSSEIMFLAGADALFHGMDSVCQCADAEQYAVSLARRTGSLVSVSGPVDCVTDGNTLLEIAGGSPMMRSITAMGCTASALSAAFLAAGEDFLCASASAMALMGAAGEYAGRLCSGPGTFVPHFLDYLASFDPEAAFNTVSYGQKSA